MSTLKIDMVDGNSGKLTSGGWELTRTATVYGVTGDAHARILAAWTATGLSIGNAHPSRAGCLLREAIPTAVSTDIVQFQLLYRDFYFSSSNTDSIEVGASVSQIQTNVDYNDADLFVDYTYPIGYKTAPDEVGLAATQAAPSQSGFVDKLIPCASVTITKEESSNPLSTAKTYVGKVNSGTFDLDGSASARTWLCTGIVGRSNDGGSSYLVTYTFQYRPDTWDATYLFIDPHTGKPPKDLVADTGKKTSQIYVTANFGSLNLT